MTDRKPFEPIGGISRVDVCVALIEALPPKEPISDQVVRTELTDRTGAPVDRPSVLAAMWGATERMHSAGTPGAERVRGGWVRLDSDGLMRWADQRDARASRQLRRRGQSAALVDREQVDGAKRLRLDLYVEADRRVGELTHRRARRLRPA